MEPMRAPNQFRLVLPAVTCAISRTTACLTLSRLAGSALLSQEYTRKCSHAFTPTSEHLKLSFHVGDLARANPRHTTLGRYSPLAQQRLTIGFHSRFHRLTACAVCDYLDDLLQ